MGWKPTRYICCSLPSSPVSHDHGSKCSISWQIELRFHKVRTFWNTQDRHTECIKRRRVSILSWTSVGPLPAQLWPVLLTSKLYSTCYKLSSGMLRFFSLMHSLKYPSLQNEISMVYRNSKSHLCWPPRWCGTTWSCLASSSSTTTQQYRSNLSPAQDVDHACW